MDRSVSLKYPVSFSFSLFLSRTATVCPPSTVLLAPSSPSYVSRCMRSFPPLTPSLSSILSDVLFVTSVSPPRSHTFFSVSYYITDSLPAPFARVTLCISLHVAAYLSFVLLLCICILCVRLLFPSRARRVSFGQSCIVYNAFLAVHVPRP